MRIYVLLEYFSSYYLFMLCVLCCLVTDKLSALTVEANEQNKWRRQILNEFLDLKGNIRVFCRVKPLDSRNLRATVASDTRNVIITLTESKRKTYNFDRVFEPDSSQGQVALIFFFWRLSSSLRLFHYDVDTVTYR